MMILWNLSKHFDMTCKDDYCVRCQGILWCDNGADETIVSMIIIIVLVIIIFSILLVELSWLFLHIIIIIMRTLRRTCIV